MQKLYPCRSLLAIADGLKKRPGLFYSGIGLAILHVLYVVKIVFWICTASGADLGQWQMIWCKLGYVDFPISLIVGIFLQAPFDVNVDFLYILPPQMDSLISFWIPALFHGIVGTLFYFLLPTIIWKFAKWFSQMNRNAVIHGILLTLPILCAISEFTGFPIHFLPRPFNTRLLVQSGWVGLWLLLLICAVLAQKQNRLRALLHFAAFPFVIWFLLRAVMFTVITNCDLYNLYENGFISFLLCYP